MNKHIRNILKILIGIPLLLIGAELLLYSYCLLKFDSNNVYLPNIKSGRNPNPNYLPGIHGKSYFTTNSMGLRGASPKTDCAYIVAIGNSTTQNVWLDDSETWPQIVMDCYNKTSNKKVIVNSAGHGGLVARHETLILQSLIDKELKIDVALLLTAAPDASMWLRQEGEYRGLEKKYEKKAFVNAVTPWKHFPKKRKELLISQYAKIVEKKIVKGFRTVLHHSVSKKRDGASMQKDKDNYQQAEQLLSLPEELLKSQPVALADYKQQMLNTVRLCKKNNITPILITQPVNYGKNMSDKDKKNYTWQYKNKAITPKLLHEIFAKYAQINREIAQQEKIVCIPLFSYMEDKSECYIDEIHFNEKGAKIAGEYISSFITDI